MPAAKALVKGHRKAIFAADGKPVNARRSMTASKLGAGATIKGPAIIEEVTTTIVIEPKWSAKLDASGSYVITRKIRSLAFADVAGRIVKNAHACSNQIAPGPEILRKFLSQAQHSGQPAFSP